VQLVHKAPQVLLEQQALRAQLVQPEPLVHKELLVQRAHKDRLV